MLTRQVIRTAVEAALEEDAPNGDITCETTIPAEAHGTARLVARQAGVMSGIAVFEAAFAAQNPDVTVHADIKDGERFEPRQTLATVSGPVRDLLTAERIALNFTQRMCGIATLTARFVEAVKEYGTLILDTRKTVPGLRALQKYAVRCGGGANHRFGLDDAVLIKDNHVAVAGGIRAAVEAARANCGHLVKIEVEVDNLDQLRELLELRVDAVLLDNMGPELLREAVALVDGRMITEASGRITVETAVPLAEAGVDLISSGALTHSARVLDVGLDYLSA